MSHRGKKLLYMEAGPLLSKTECKAVIHKLRKTKKLRAGWRERGTRSENVCIKGKQIGHPLFDDVMDRAASTFGVDVNRDSGIRLDAVLYPPGVERGYHEDVVDYYGDETLKLTAILSLTDECHTGLDFAGRSQTMYIPVGCVLVFPSYISHWVPSNSQRRIKLVAFVRGPTWR